jgi:hypothetical protein
MLTSCVPVHKQLSLREGNVAENWRKFRSCWNNFEIAAGYSKKDEAVRVALLLIVTGEESVELFDTFEWSDVANKVEILPVLDKFEAYCKPKASELLETYRFLPRKKEQGEPIEAYVTALRTLSEGCGIADKERRIRDQVVFGIRDDRVRERLLRDTNPTIDRVKETIPATEMAEHQLKTIVGDSEDPTVNKVFKSNHKKK